MILWKFKKKSTITCALGESNVMLCFWWVYQQDFSGFLTCFDEGIQCKSQALFLSKLNGLTRYQYDMLKVLLKINDQNLPFGCAKYCYVLCANKMPCFACYFELSYWKPACMQIEHLKYAKILTYVFERCMWSLGTCFQLYVARWGYWMCGRHRLTKHPDCLVYLHVFIASYNFLAACIWCMKGMEVVSCLYKRCLLSIGAWFYL